MLSLFNFLGESLQKTFEFAIDDHRSLNYYMINPDFWRWMA